MDHGWRVDVGPVGPVGRELHGGRAQLQLGYAHMEGRSGLDDRDLRGERLASPVDHWVYVPNHLRVNQASGL